jgi:hypothetical protein
MNHKKIIAISALLAANALMFASVSAIAKGTLPAEQVQGTTTYLTGGVGEDEASAMKEAAPTFPLSLEFIHHAKPKDEFLADVDVTIQDQKGNQILNVVADGPFLLAKVAPGKYTIVAKANGKIKTAHATITARKPEHLIFSW